MPNWCYNEIEIVADEKTLDDMEMAARKDKLLDFIKPMPSELEGTKSPSDEPNWYDWSVENWGTKWDVSPVRIEKTKKKLSIVFDSAWSPPLEAIDFLWNSGRVKSIYLSYWEPGMDFGGLYKNGENVHISGMTEAYSQPKHKWIPEMKNIDKDFSVYETLVEMEQITDEVTNV